VSDRSGSNGAVPPAPGKRRLGLALAGGGPEGAVYEIGALRALDEVLDGIRLEELDVYVGVSAGSVVAACLANGVDTAELCRAIVSTQKGEHPFVPETFLTPAGREWLRQGSKLPGLLGEALWDYVKHPCDKSLLGALTHVGRALPVALFDNDPLRLYLERLFDEPGRTNRFDELGPELYVVAVDLDSGKGVRFGENGAPTSDAARDLTISRAVQASTALPGLYAPVEIGGRLYVDGVLLKTVHASVALDAGAELLLCINPIVPVDTVHAVEEGVMKRGRLADRGLPTVLSQTFRTLIQSRLEVGMRAYQSSYQGRDVVLFQPRRDDYRMFFTNIFSIRERVTVAEHAYRQTRRDLRERRDELEPILARHGITLRHDVLDDESREIWDHVGLPPEARRPGRSGKPSVPTAKTAPPPPSADSEADADPLETTRRLAATLDRLDALVARSDRA
jgi:predicted acylesterase/phospholipase RssA